MANIVYHIAASRPEAHIFEVELHLAQPEKAGQILRLPDWIPGSYMIRDFAKNIIQLKAFEDERPIDVQKLDKSSWQLEAVEGPVVVRYEVYAWDLSVRTAYLDQTRGFFNGTSTFLEVLGQQNQPIDVYINPPEGNNYHYWRVGTTLKRSTTERYDFGLYHADNYDELIDHPVELGEFQSTVFDVHGIRHEMIISGRHDTDMDRLNKDLQIICTEQVRFWGEFPDSEYLFMTYASENSYGGLEHRASTALVCPRAELPYKAQQQMTDGYLNFLTLCSHEYFHTWNIKRIKPAAFSPYTLNKESHTSLLWVFEGCTVYYESLPLVRAGIINIHQYLNYLSKVFTRVTRSPGRFKQTLLESSFDAWTKLYQADENAVNSMISYYSKGAMAALALDLHLREQGFNLDSIMKTMWEQYGSNPKGLEEGAFEQLLIEQTGLDLHDFLDQLLRSTEDIPLAPLLSKFAVKYELRTANSPEDKGGLPAHAEPCPWFGADYQTVNNALKLVRVYDDSPAQQAGLSAGDTLIALNDIRISPQNFTALLERIELYQSYSIHAFRRDELKTFQLKMKLAPKDRVCMSLDQHASDDALKKLTRWTGPQS
ncbi:MAG: M61 family metallopeptidase [bacterium]